MKKSICILFAGPAGSGKSPIAYFLSWNLGLPIFNNDAIRTEVLEDTLNNKIDDKLYLEIRNKRLEKLVASKKDFILDVSIDRTWNKIKAKLVESNYKWLIISMDISEDLLEKTAKAKKYNAPKQMVDKWYKEHQDFLKENIKEPMLSITDENFKDRLEISLNKSKEFISELN